MPGPVLKILLKFINSLTIFLWFYIRLGCDFMLNFFCFKYSLKMVLKKNYPQISKFIKIKL